MFHSISTNGLNLFRRKASRTYSLDDATGDAESDMDSPGQVTSSPLSKDQNQNQKNTPVSPPTSPTPTRPANIYTGTPSRRLTISTNLSPELQDDQSSLMAQPPKTPKQCREQASALETQHLRNQRLNGLTPGRGKDGGERVLQFPEPPTPPQKSPAMPKYSAIPISNSPTTTMRSSSVFNTPPVPALQGTRCDTAMGKAVLARARRNFEAMLRRSAELSPAPKAAVAAPTPIATSTSTKHVYANGNNNSTTHNTQSRIPVRLSTPPNWPLPAATPQSGRYRHVSAPIIASEKRKTKNVNVNVNVNMVSPLKFPAVGVFVEEEEKEDGKEDRIVVENGSDKEANDDASSVGRGGTVLNDSTDITEETYGFMEV